MDQQITTLVSGHRVVPCFRALLVSGLLVPQSGNAQDGLYHAIPIGSDKLSIQAFNDAGQLAGNMPGGTFSIHPFVWSVQSGVVNLIGSIPKATGGVASMNNLGHVLIYSSPDTYLWKGESPALHIGSLSPTHKVTHGYDVNDLGQIVGAGIVLPRSTNPDPKYVAFLWDPDDGFRFLGDLPGGNLDSGAREINNRGLVAGESVSSCGLDAFVWTSSSGMKGIGPPPGYPCIVDVEDMNEAGVIVGNTVKWEKPGALPLIWNPSTGYVVLSPLPGPNGCGQLLDINDDGVAIGIAYTDCSKPQTRYAFVWDERNGFRLLSEILSLDAATAVELPVGVTWYGVINNREQLLGRHEMAPYNQYRFDPVLLGDMNCDGVVDEADLQPFLGQMLKYAGTTAPLFDGEECGWWIGDINQDALLNEDDLAPFLALLP